MFWEIYQSRGIARANRNASRAQSKTEQTQRHIERLENKLEALAMACQAMWELLESRTKFTQDDLEKKMEEIDLRDGIKDGKISKTVATCPSCGRKTSIRRPTCLYCGEPNPNGGTFGQNLP